MQTASLWMEDSSHPVLPVFSGICEYVLTAQHGNLPCYTTIAGFACKPQTESLLQRYLHRLAISCATHQLPAICKELSLALHEWQELLTLQQIETLRPGAGGYQPVHSLMLYRRQPGQQADVLLQKFVVSD